MKAIFLICILLTTLSSPGAQQNTEQPQQLAAHDIDDYDKAGPYENRRLPDGKLPDDQVERIRRSRAWLWAHWIERRLGVLIETSHTIEGDRSTFYYFVEPDKEGIWRVTIKIERVLHNYKYKDPDCKRFEIQYFNAYSVARVDPEPDEQGHYRPVPKDELRNPANYLIQMKVREVDEATLY